MTSLITKKVKKTCNHLCNFFELPPASAGGKLN